MKEGLSRKVKITISGGYGNGNAGDEALMITMIEHLREAFGGQCEIKIFSDNVSYSDSRYAEDFIYSGGRGILEEGKKGLSRITWFFQNIRAIWWCDLFITGGGTILQDSTNVFFVPFWLAKIFLAMIFRKRTMMYGIGVGPVATKFARCLSRFIVNRMSLITLRGSSSYEELKNMGVNRPPIHVLSDPALVLKPAPEDRVLEILKSEGVDSKRPYIAFAVRQWYIHHRKSLQGSPVWKAQDRAKYEAMVSELASVADHLITKFGNQIVFVSMSIVGTKDDRLAASDIINQMKYAAGNAHIIKGEYKPSEIKGLIGLSKLLVAMRLHSAIFAVPLGVPVFSIAYGKKMRDFMNDVGLGDYVLDLDDIGNGKLLHRLDEVMPCLEKLTVKEALISEKERLAQKNALLAAGLFTGEQRDCLKH